jgi:toxin ParE1/3/4
MHYQVHITLAAWRDLEEITDWIAEHDSVENAASVLNRLVEVAESLAGFPERGSRPSELPAGMAADYRQVFFKPYRIIYRVREDRVEIHLVADGRRNLHSFLLRRLTCS